jgi:mono/diheme cytochrome c family protein
LKLSLILLVLFIATACTTAPPATPETASPLPPPTIDPADTALVAAEATYINLCLHCHGEYGSGQPDGEGPGTEAWTRALGYDPVPRHDSAGRTWQHPDQLLFEVIKYGIDNPLNHYTMIGYGHALSDDEIWALIDYIRRLWTDEQRAHQAQLTARFAEDQPFWEEAHLDRYTEASGAASEGD